MKYIPIRAVRNQKMLIDLEGSRLELNIVFNNIGFWFLNLDFNGIKVNGVKLSSGVFHLESNNLPFDLTVKSEGGLDPYKVDDFLQRCKLYLVEKPEVETIKNTEIRV